MSAWARSFRRLGVRGSRGVWVGGDEGCEFGEVRSSADVGSFVECCHAWGPEDVDPDVFVDGECVVWCRTRSPSRWVACFSAVSGVLLIDDSSAGSR